MKVRFWIRPALLGTALSVAAIGGCGERASPNSMPRLGNPSPGKLYHGVFLGGESAGKENPTPESIAAYHKIVSKQVAWVYFSHDWVQSRAFPRQKAEQVRKTGAVPFVRLMLGSTPRAGRREEGFTIQAILDGEFDRDFKQWARDARQFHTPLLVEWGTESNGEWFSWNGKWNGGAKTKGFGDPKKPDGPERFVAAYRHIIRTMRAEGADNITWVFHVNSKDSPREAWNRFENYYPGDEFIDWVGVSVYGPQTPLDRRAESFRTQMDRWYPRFRRLTASKPAAVLEFGSTAGSRAADPARWASDALDDLLGLRWPRVIGFSWWNGRWQNDADRRHDTTMRVQDIPALARVFRRKFEARKDRLEVRPLVVEGNKAK